MKKEPLSIIIVKTLLAVVIFAGMGTIIIGGGYIIGEYCKNQDNQFVKLAVQEVTIATDKTEYERGEEINIVVKNNKHDKIFYCGAGDLSGWRFNLKKKENGNWKELDKRELFPTVWTPSIRELAPNETFSVAIKKEVIEKPIDSGTYEIGFKFFLTLDKSLENIRENCWERESNIIYSNEFTIKEKVKDGTADWQTYRNEEFGFEMKHPVEYVIKKEKLTHFALGKLFENMDIYQIMFDTQIDYDRNFGMGDFYISMISNPSRLSLDVWFEKNNIPKFGTKNVILSEINDQKIIIDDIDSVDRIISGGGGNMREIIISKDDKIIILGIDSSNVYPNYRDGSDSKNQYIKGGEKIEEFNQILSTFKFIEK